jgi:hypothetical protein
MEFDSQRLQALLDLLVESGVEEFEGFGFHVRFTEGLFVPENKAEVVDVRPRDDKPEPRNLWEVPELWPGGRPPSFPSTKKDK